MKTIHLLWPTRGLGSLLMRPRLVRGYVGWGWQSQGGAEPPLTLMQLGMWQRWTIGHCSFSEDLTPNGHEKAADPFLQVGMGHGVHDWPGMRVLGGAHLARPA